MKKQSNKIEKRFSKMVDKIKKSPLYTIADGEKMGIISIPIKNNNIDENNDK